MFKTQGDAMTNIFKDFHSSKGKDMYNSWLNKSSEDLNNDKNLLTKDKSLDLLDSKKKKKKMAISGVVLSF